MKKIKIVTTKDSSETFFSDKYQETYHSVSGAVEESVKKFVEPCDVKRFTKEVKVLDICFGIGYNSCALIDAVLKVNPDCKIKIIGLENDKSIINRIKVVNPAFENYDIFKELAKSLDYSYKKDNISIKILVGDARSEIKKIKEEFDIVFLDPFSPKKCPELWTEEFLKDVYNLMKKQGVMTTYSCATKVRENMKKVGFKVEDGPSVGRNAPSTIAKK